MAGIDLATAYVNIVPSAKGIKGKMQEIVDPEAKHAGDAGGEAMGASLVSKLKSIIAAAGIGVFIKQSLDAGGALQQSFGGLETLYGSAAESAKKFAMQAAEAGISANTYSEQAVSFGAALKQAFKGSADAEELAAKAANTAILDMADNAAKMGTDIGSIQTAYQGFAKQNYTMLDNLKLGYGGTKEEMARLLADASKLEGAMGKTFDMNNLGDVYEAIHLIQEDLGLTGVAAKEASETFSGSFSAMKAAAENVMAALTLGMDLKPSLIKLTESAENFLFNNLIPMVGNLIQGIGEAIPMLLEFLFEDIAVSIGNLMGKLDDGLLMNMVNGIIGLMKKISSVFLEYVPHFVKIGGELIGKLLEGLSNFHRILVAAQEIFGWFINMIIEMLPEMVSTGAEMLQNMIEGLMEEIPELIDVAMSLVNNLIDAFFSINWLDLGVKIIAAVLSGLGSLIGEIPVIFQTAWNKVLDSARHVWDGIRNIFGNLGNFFGQVFGNAWQRVKDIFSVGGRIFDGIKDGILSAFKSMVNAIIRGINSVVAIPFNGINSALAAIRNVSIAGLRPFSWISTIPVPQIPYLAKGGTIADSGMAIVGEAGAELVNLPRGASVTPLNSNNNAFVGMEKRLEEMQRSIYSMAAAIASYRPQIVLDSGVLVGEIAPSMDDELGKLSMRELRGV